MDNPKPYGHSPMDNPNPMDIHLWTTLTLHSPMDNPNPKPMDNLWTLTLWTFTYGQP